MRRVNWKGRAGPVIAGAVMLLTTACASQPVVSNFPDMRAAPPPEPVLMSPEERGQAIEELQDAAKKNQSG